MTVSSDPITNCPVCHYKRPSATSSIPCPCCNLHKGDYLRAWYTPPLRPLVTVFLYGLLSAFALALSISTFAGDPPTRTETKIIVSLMATMVAALVPAHMLRLHSFVAGTESELIYKHAFRSVRRVAWEDLHIPDDRDTVFRHSKWGPKAVFIPSEVSGRSIRKEVVPGLRTMWKERVDKEMQRRLLLRYCPQCAYDLEGLPDVYSCPECGFGYDLDTHVYWMMQERSSLLGLVVTTLIIIQFLVRDIARRPAFVVVVVGIAACYLIFRLTGEKVPKRPFLAVGGKGITVRNELRKAEFIPWQNMVIKFKPFRIFHKQDDREKFIGLPAVSAKPLIWEHPILKLIYDRWRGASEISHESRALPQNAGGFKSELS